MAIEPTITIDYVEMNGSPDEGFDEEGRFFAQQKLRCAFADRVTLMRQLKGGYRDNDTNEMILPFSYPWVPEARVLSVSALASPAMTGQESTTGAQLGNYEHAMLTVNYSIREVSFQDDADNIKLVDHRIEGGGEFLTFDPDNRIWWYDEDDMLQAEQAPGILRTNATWTMTVFDVTTPPETLFSLIGSANSVAISDGNRPISTWTNPIGTLRYDFPSLSKTVTTEGDERWTVTMQFSWTPAVPAYPSGTSTWNHFYRPGRTQPERIYTSAATRDEAQQWNVYVLNDLDAMITAVQAG